MPLPTFGNGETLVLHRRVPQVVDGQRVFDSYGNIVYVESTQTITGIAIWPNTATEFTQAADRTNSSITAVLPVDVVVDAADYFTWRGKDWQVQGDAERYQNPHTGTNLQTVLLDRVEG